MAPAYGDGTVAAGEHFVLLGDVLPTPRVLFVGGKGGVGKTTVSSAIAYAQAQRGHRVLLVSTDPAHSLSHLWERALSDPERELLATTSGGRVDGLEVDPAATTSRHLEAVRARLHRLMPDHLAGEVDRHIELAASAPGTHEAALLERIAELVTTAPDRYDALIFDTAPSGHTLRLLTIPESMAGWARALIRRRERASRFGDLAEQLGAERQRSRSKEDDVLALLEKRRQLFAGFQQTLQNPAECGFLLVFTPERLPVLESRQLYEGLRDAGVTLVGLVANRRAPASEGSFLAERRDREEHYVKAIAAAIPDVPMFELPMLRGDLEGPDAVAAIAELLS